MLRFYDTYLFIHPVCRAWMRNEPHNTNMAPRLRTPTPEPDKDDAEDEDNNDESSEKDSDKNVFKLPPPEPLGQYILLESIKL